MASKYVSFFHNKCPNCNSGLYYDIALESGVCIKCPNKEQSMPKAAMVDPVVEAVRNDLLNRSKVGIEKYGVTLDRKDLNLRDWLQHTYEETLDQANYLKCAIMEIDGGTKDEKATKA
jgi:hypothetical protein